MKLITASLLLICLAFMLSACTVTEYGVPYDYGSTWEEHSPAGRWEGYNHFRAFGEPGPPSLDPHLR